MESYINNQTYISSGDMSADVTGDTIDGAYATKVSATCVNTAGSSPSGTIYIQTSNDNSTWVNSGVAAGSAAISAAETNLLYQDLYARYVRIFYDYTSGSASLDVAITLK
mgnify:FL=1